MIARKPISSFSMLRKFNTSGSVRALAVSFLSFSTAAATSSSTPQCASTDSVADNALMIKTGLPHFKAIQTDHVVPAVEHDIASLERDFAALERKLANPGEGEVYAKTKKEYKYESVVEELEKIQAPLAYSWGVVGHLMGVRVCVCVGPRPSPRLTLHPFFATYRSAIPPSCARRTMQCREKSSPLTRRLVSPSLYSRRCRRSSRGKRCIRS